MEKQPKLRQLVREKGLTAAYLTRKCKEQVPGWCVSPLPQKKAFTPEQKRARRTYTEKAAQYNMDRWQSTVFLDEHTFYRRPISLPAIHMRGTGQRRYIRDTRLHRYPWDYPKLHFMYAVHWKLGVLGPYWISDSKGWKRAKQWKVSCRHHPAAPTHPPTSCHLISVSVPSAHSPWDGRLYDSV